MTSGFVVTHVLVVCLYDAYSLLPDKALNSILFLLLQTGTRHPGADLAIVASANTIGTDFSGYIDPYVMSLFHPVEISFPPYSRDEIKSILQDRVRRALVPGAVPDEVLDVVADRAASCGDIRMGLDLAWIDLLGRIVFTNPNCVRLC
jgi:cell division control protein 6